MAGPSSSRWTTAPSRGRRGWNGPGEVIRKVADGGADAILTTYGMARTFGKELAPLGVIIRTDGGASTIGPDISQSAPLYSVEDALRLGVDGVVANAGPGHRNEVSTWSGWQAWPPNAIGGVWCWWRK